jgi:PGF-pre-PGF domain-containing protein
MKYSQSKVFFAIILLSVVNVNAAHALQLLFDSAGTQYAYVPINYHGVNGFYFNITGGEHLSSLPSNISVDVGNDGINDWKYEVYDSKTIARDDMLLYAWSSNPDPGTIYVQSGLDNGASGVSLGSITNNEFLRNDIAQDGNIGIRTNDATDEQMLSITTNTTTLHAFFPALSPVGTAGLYIAEGGSTYFCNSDHSFFLTQDCDLTPAQALTDNHIARKANISWFNLTEPIGNPKMKDAVNKALQGCSLPCNVVIKVTSGSAGAITLDDFKITGPERPAQISMQETSNNYQITITPNASLTSVKYGYLTMPKVYVVPFVASDDSTTPDASQTQRLSILSSNLKDAWDSLTNRSHPLNFTFFMNPVAIPNYELGGNFSVFITGAENTFVNQTAIKTPAILVIADIKDYFPSMEPYNSVTTPDEKGIISIIYMNGFSDSNSVTGFYRYDEEILTNILLHELAHTFIIYPVKDKLFYSGHPSSFTDLAGFSSYSPGESPTGNEGYYETYSVLNQIRPYITEEEIGRPAELSPLDRMLLGTLSPYFDENYTFYSGSITRSGDRFIMSPMTKSKTSSASNLYQLSTDGDWWDVRTNSSFVAMGTSQSFNAAKANQKGKALMVYANDAGHPDHFKVFNANAGSVQSTINPVPYVQLTSPSNGETSTGLDVAFVCQAYNLFDNLTLYTNVHGSWQAEHSTTQGKLNHTINGISNGNYKWNCRARYNSVSYWASSNITVTVNYAPAAFCGDAVCNNGETCSTCSQDCGTCSNQPSGGGGGGGGAASPSTTSKYWPTLSPGQNAMKVTSNNFAITDITFKSSTSASQVTLSIKKISGKPSATTNITGKVYTYLEITLTNLGNSNLTGGISIRFDVPIGWLKSNGIEASDIALYRYAEKQWDEIPTAVSSSTNDKVSFEAISPGFSYYAIVGKNRPEIKERTEVPKLEKNVTVENVTKGQKVTINASPENKKPYQPIEEPQVKKQKFTRFWWVFGAALVLIIFAIVLVIRKRRSSL